jgi:RNA-directed DNA polymerase
MGKKRAKVSIHPRSIERFKEKVREITARNKGVPTFIVIRKLSAFVKGWGGHYARIATCAMEFRALDGWCRRRVRQFFWVQWKTPANRFRQLVKRTVNPKKAKSVCLSRSKWGPSNSEALRICFNNERLQKIGLVSLTSLRARPQAL